MLEFFDYVEVFLACALVDLLLNYTRSTWVFCHWKPYSDSMKTTMVMVMVMARGKRGVGRVNIPDALQTRFMVTMESIKIGEGEWFHSRRKVFDFRRVLRYWRGRRRACHLNLHNKKQLRLPRKQFVTNFLYRFPFQFLSHHIK